MTLKVTKRQIEICKCIERQKISIFTNVFCSLIKLKCKCLLLMTIFTFGVKKKKKKRLEPKKRNHGCFCRRDKFTSQNRLHEVCVTIRKLQLRISPWELQIKHKWTMTLNLMSH